ncbi:Dihydrolipoyllysine-residue acetyltransferase component of pyruvate dehydrogenase complex,branched-chain alpha-keto acid dehydrogenase subunit E2,dihydrolipoyllysine-residue succinyltransferase, E2 component of oxoglutarate dehydrogenase (succinyl-transferring) complex,2-oxoacid dehydrogenases acyltransferase (catalytic domain) [Chlamydia poikilotherma]|uniref:Dihydrolipoamide acetyltransferase component of pyruvate dehydrogenase complex n=1 Tax=Chlamydia poikilotherma TaxID=1967783 RepID=A0A3B0PLW3_9CHLA|nr:dihydrolipoamide acetyltransferase family protein [Chlamydia poikilotherma]SYX08709.1 Dihydrolipoyllysine-residue acetyltransferase component of pyruvate dehydrogenase complex,branched-chain alpha-keto acid dehydrogenase subunit E2,dihydrolipoyllysine-residue succinyltransferase, E2 component of oxoglutarate dehydrogenase (succinyl-transferring) complex,2-oxoacid dehydrogenases acyltransferase (catalytic domain) [Chlamydia poikilotherma]
MFEFRFPKIGETASGGFVVRWLKQVGEYIAKDEPIIEVSTDKIATELASPKAGKLTCCLVNEGDEVASGEILAIIDTELSVQEEVVLQESSPEISCSQDPGNTAAWFSPAVLSLAHREGISIQQLQQISGTGNEGRVTRKDLESYISEMREPSCSKIANANENRIPMSPLRRAIASSLSKSSDEVPHASLIVDIDVTDLMNLISEEKDRFFATHGVKLTITSFIIQCLAKALEQFPLLNGSLDGDTIIVKKSINVGVAVNLNKEGVVVPVIRNCQDRGLVSIAKTLADLSTRSRANKLDPSETQEGSVTVTNFGMTGALIGMPIIRYPEVAILGIGTIQKRVVVRDDDSLAIRRMVYVTLTFDHRVLDGIYGSEFLTSLKNRLESVTMS